MDSQTELDINEFYINVLQPLEIEELISIVVFKSLDRNKSGKVKLEHFGLVVNSYRKDFKQQLSMLQQNKEKAINFKDLKDNCLMLNKILKENNIKNIFIKTIYKDFTSDMFELIRACKQTQTNNSEEDLYSLLSRSSCVLTDILVFLKRGDGRIYKKDFDRLMFFNNSTDEFVPIKEVLDYHENYVKNSKRDINEDKRKLMNIDFNNNFDFLEAYFKEFPYEPFSDDFFVNFLNNKSIKVTKYSKFSLSENQNFWIIKFKQLLAQMNLTPKVVFAAALSEKQRIQNINNDSVANDKDYFNESNYKLNQDRINLDILKKKLKLLFPVNMISASDINNISDALDVNNNRTLTLSDLTELLDIGEEMDFFSSIAFSQFNKTNPLGNSFYKSSLNNNSKENNDNFNNHSVHKGEVELTTLPIKGNYSALEKIQEELQEMKYNNNEEEISNSNSQNYNDTKSTQFINPRVLNNSERMENTIAKKVTASKKNLLTVSKIKKENKEINDKTNASNAMLNSKSSALGLSNLTITRRLENKKANDVVITKFLKDLEVFESGDWVLIELFEEIPIERFTYKKHINNISTNELMMLFFLPKFYPTISKQLLFSVCRLLDNDMDGIITYKDLYLFLLEFLHHKSVKLALKDIVYIIEIKKEKSVEDYISSVFPDSTQILSFVSFTKFFIEEFELQPQIIKKIYYETLEILTRQITVADLIDLLNEYSYINNKNINDAFSTHFPFLDSKNKQDDDNNAINVLDKKFFENKMKEFVSELMRAFPLSVDSDNKNKTINKYFSLSPALNEFLKLEDNLDLSSFRERVVKVLKLDLSFGISLFQMLKVFSGKSSISKNDFFSCIDSYIFLNCTNDNKVINLINNFSKNIECFHFMFLKASYIIALMESNGPDLKYCFESLSYSGKVVSIIEIKKCLQMFYPNFPKQSLYFICLELEKIVSRIKFGSDININTLNKNKNNPLLVSIASDALNSTLNNNDINNSNANEFIINKLNYSKAKGFVSYLRLAEFIFINSSKYKLSEILVFKYLASICDFYDEEIDYSLFKIKISDIYQQGIYSIVNKHITKNSSITINEHFMFFKDMLKLPHQLSEQLFFYLISQTSEKIKQNKENNDIKALEQYNVSELCSSVDYYRVNLFVSETRVVENTMQIESLNHKRNKVINILNEFICHKSLSPSLDKLNMKLIKVTDINNQNSSNNKDNKYITYNDNNYQYLVVISVLEIFYILNIDFKVFFSSISINNKDNKTPLSYDQMNINQKLKYVCSFIDKHKRGYVTYLELLNTLSSLIEGFEAPVLLHLRYLSLTKKAEFSSIKDFLFFKNLNSNQYLNFKQFYNSFYLEMLKDQILATNFFDRVKELKGKFSGLVSVENLVELIFNYYSSKTDINCEDNSVHNDLNNSKIKEINASNIDFEIKEFIKRHFDYIQICIDEIDPVKNLNQFGKLNSQLLYATMINNKAYFFNNEDSNSIKDTNSNITDKDIEIFNKSILAFIQYFSSINNTLFDALKLLEFIDVHFIVLNDKKFNSVSFEFLSKEAYSNLKDLYFNNTNKAKTKKNKSKNNINYSEFNNKETLVISKDFLTKLNLENRDEMILTINDFCNLGEVLFDLSNFNLIFLFYHILFKENNSINKNTNNKNSNNSNNVSFINEVSLKLIFNYLNIKFSDNSLNEDELLEKKKQKLTNKAKLSLLLLGAKLSKEKRVKALFEKYDYNHDGILNREEFLNFLNFYLENEINDSQKLEIVNLADINGDDVIDYTEFIHFILLICKKEGKKINNDNEIYLDTENTDKNRNNYKNIKGLTNLNLLDPNITKNNYKGFFHSQYISSKQDLENLYNKNLTTKIKLSKLEEFYLFCQNQFIIDFESFDNIEVDLINANKVNRIDNHNPDNYDYTKENKVVYLKDLIDIIKKRSNLRSFISNCDEDFDLEIFNDLLDFGFNGKSKDHIKIKDLFRREKWIDYDFFMMRVKSFNPDDSKHDHNEIKRVTTNNTLNTSKNITEENRNNIDNLDSDASSKVKGLFFKDYKYNNKDFYTREYVALDKNNKQFIKKDTYTTILLSEEAALKKCEELFNDPKTKVFTDAEFGFSEENKSLNKKSLYFGETPKGQVSPDCIEWNRMNEISENPVFIDEGAMANDVMQGALGDCWLISALSIIATKDHLLRGEYKESFLDDNIITDKELLMLSTGIYPPLFHGFRHKKIFCFKFFKENKWYWVIIDDKLPCLKNQKKLIFGKCFNENEFWVPLIEKAYAKLHGCYQSLVSGFIDDGLVDLTGLVSQKMSIDESITNNKDKKEELWYQLLEDTSRVKKISKLKEKENKESKNKDNQNKSKQTNNAIMMLNPTSTLLKSNLLTTNNTMVGCSVDAKVVESEIVYNNNKCGILAGHAYAILDAFEIPNQKSKSTRKTSRLLRIRNPWGFKEWNGKWSDSSQEVEEFKDIIQDILINRLKDDTETFSLDDEDGCFLISYKDFRNIFNRLFISRDFPQSYFGISILDEWNTSSFGGIPINNTKEEYMNWAKNPQYYLKLNKTSTIYFSLQQPDGRMYYDSFPYKQYTRKCCLIIMRAQSDKALNIFDANNIVEISPIRMHRENSFFKTLEEGEYIVVPSIMLEKSNNIGGKFWLNFYIEDEIYDDKYYIHANGDKGDNILECLSNFTIKKLNGEYKSSKFV